MSSSVPDNWSEMKDDDKIAHLDKMIKETDDDELEDNELEKLEVDEHGN